MKRIFTTTLLITLFGILSIFAQERIYTPELSSPANGAINQMPDVVLDWNAVTGGNTGIIRYELQLAVDPAFNNPVVFETEFLSAIQTSELIFGETYYWRVRAIDGTQISDWSEVWSFRVIRRSSLVKPTDASEQNTDLEIGWNPITGITGYEYQIDTAYYWKGVSSGLTTALNAVAVVDDSHAWLVGAGGKITFWDGVSFSNQASGITQDLLAVNFLDGNNGWAVGKGGKVVYYNGTEWTEQTSGTTADLRGVHFTDASNGWAVGIGGVVRYFNGTEWASAYTASADLYAVWAADNSHVWAVGKGGLIVHYNGNSWASQTSGTTKDLFGVSFGDMDNGYAVGKTGALVQYAAGAWTNLVNELTTKDLSAVNFTSPENGWIVGKTGTVLQFDGIEWYAQSGGTNGNLLGVDFGISGGFIAGENGVAIRYNDDAFSSPIAEIMSVPPDKTTAKLIDLMFGTQYFWRMRALHSLDISGWSGARSFVTVATIEHDKPNNNATNQNLDVLIRWDKISDLVSYEIQIDEDPAFGSPVLLSTTNNQINASFIKFGTEYKWRGRALHAFDTSAWSEPWTFSTVNTVTQTAPANNATDVSLSPVLDWDPLTGIGGYLVQLSPDANFNEVIAWGVIEPEFSAASVLLVLEKETMYYWHVRAFNGLDSTDWSPTWAFTTLPPVGIDEPAFESMLSLYPNPAANTVYFDYSGKTAVELQLTFTDLVGKTVMSREVSMTAGNKSIPVDISSLKNGIYMVRMSDQENIVTRKLVVKR